MKFDDFRSHKELNNSNEKILFWKFVSNLISRNLAIDVGHVAMSVMTVVRACNAVHGDDR